MKNEGRCGERAVDRGYAWVIAGACFVSLFASIGFSIGGIGVATVSFGAHFPNATNEALGWIGGLRNFQFLASPLAVILIRWVGCRLTAVGGSVLSGAAIAFSALSYELWHAYLLYSVIAGVGVALTYTSTFHILGLYFNKKKNLAFSIVALGNALGIVVFPYLLQSVTDLVGHVNALYVTAALKVIEVASGCLFAPLPDLESGKSYESPVESSNIPSQSSLAPELEGSNERSGQSNLAMSDKVTEQYRSVGSSTEVDNISAAPTSSSAKVLKQTLSSHNAPNKMAGMISMLALLQKWQIWMLLLHAFGFGMTLVATEALMPLYVTRKGVSQDDAAFGIATIGLGFLAVAFGLLVVGTRKFDRFLVYVTTTAITGSCTVLMTTTPLVAVYLALSGLFGLGMGLGLSLFMSVLVSLSTHDTLPYVFGLYTMVKGVGSVCGPIIVGLIQTEVSDDVGWYSSGGVALFATVILIPLYLDSKKTSRNERRDGDDVGKMEAQTPA